MKMTFLSNRYINFLSKIFLFIKPDLYIPFRKVDYEEN